MDTTAEQLKEYSVYLHGTLADLTVYAPSESVAILMSKHKLGYPMDSAGWTAKEAPVDREYEVVKKILEDGAEY